MTWRGHSCLRRRDSSRRSGTVDAAREEGRDESRPSRQECLRHENGLILNKYHELRSSEVSLHSAPQGRDSILPLTPHLLHAHRNLFTRERQLRAAFERLRPLDPLRQQFIAEIAGVRFNRLREPRRRHVLQRDAVGDL